MLAIDRHLLVQHSLVLSWFTVPDDMNIFCCFVPCFRENFCEVGGDWRKPECTRAETEESRLEITW
jgi:hypothetical protein